MSAANFVLERAPTRANDPYRDGVAFAGTSDVTLATYSRAIYICANGDLKVDLIGYGDSAGATLTLTSLTAGMLIPMCVSKIYDTGTTCSGIAFF
jgi:hypothetical protein